MNKVPPPFKMVRKNESMSAEELTDFMNRHGISVYEFKEMLGVTPQAVKYWISGTRKISVTVTRIVRLLDKYPQLISEF